MVDIYTEIKKTLEQAAANAGIDTQDIHIEHPADMSHGDFSTNIALTKSKELGKNPRDIAESVVTEIEKINSECVESVEIAGPGFINIKLSQQYLSSVPGEIIKAGDTFGSNKSGKGQKVIVEYSSPNIAKPFTVGHLRSTIIGDAIANLYVANGYDVIRDNHLGDWGTQFGKLIYAILEWGDIEKIETSENKLKALVDLYVLFHDKAEDNESLVENGRNWFKKLEEGDKQARDLWQKCISWSMEEFEKIYQRLGVSFDTQIGESFFEGKMQSVLDELSEKGIAKESEGALVVFFENEKYPPFLVRRSDGATLYSTRDLATDVYRKKEYGDDVIIINEVGSEQILHFKQLFETEKMMGLFKEGQRVHISHGLYRFKDGKMSTRKGNVIWLENILNEATKRAAEINPETAEQVAIGAIKYNDLKREANKHINFDWDEILNLQGDSGPYIQYAYVRAVAITQKAQEVGIKESHTSDKTYGLENLLYRFSDVVKRAREEHAPQYIATYMTGLASEFNSFYAKEKVADPEDLNAGYKLMLVKSVGQTLKNAMNLLGIPVIERM